MELELSLRPKKIYMGGHEKLGTTDGQNGGTPPFFEAPLNDGPISRAAYYNAMLIATAREEVPTGRPNTDNKGGRATATIGRNWRER